MLLLIVALLVALVALVMVLKALAVKPDHYRRLLSVDDPQSTGEVVERPLTYPVLRFQQ